jgi:signal transduction histidine kinase
MQQFRAERAALVLVTCLWTASVLAQVDLSINKVTIVVTALAGAWLLSRLRVEKIQRNYRQVLKARQAERERIARVLHDTLFPGLNALLFRLQSWDQDSRLPQVKREEIAAVVEEARSIIVASRVRILSLRARTAPVNLSDGLREILREHSGRDVPVLGIRTSGHARSLTWNAFEQLDAIGREAIRNVFQHACASNVRVIFRYGFWSFRMVVEDDGRGIDPEILDHGGRRNHFGMVGMRERAQQLRGRIRFESNGSAGTRVAVTIPAAVAYDTRLSRSASFVDTSANYFSCRDTPS